MNKLLLLITISSVISCASSRTKKGIINGAWVYKFDTIRNIGHWKFIKYKRPDNYIKGDCTQQKSSVFINKGIKCDSIYLMLPTFIKYVEKPDE